MSELPEEPVEILAPVSGEVIDITAVPDPVFSGKMVGEGLGISEPHGSEIVAPVGGTVTMVASSGHALGLKTSSGLEFLIHLGIDTVELHGKPFDLRVAKGDEVAAGQALGTVDVPAIREAGKDPTVILVITNSAKRLSHWTVDRGEAEAGQPIAAATAKVAQPAEKSSSTSGATAASATGSAEGTATPPDNPSETRPEELTGYDALAWDIIHHVGGEDNIRSVTHCITRVRFYLRDDQKADDATVANLDGVIDVAKGAGQYQVVIGPAVEDVYAAIENQLGDAATAEDASAEESAAERPDTAWGWVKHGFSSLIGVITGSMIPIIGLLAAAGILKGILSLLLTFGVTTENSQTYALIDAMSGAVFFFLPIFVGYTAARRLGSDPIIVAIIGGVLTYPSLIEMSQGEGRGSIAGMSLNGEFFGLPYHMADYSSTIFPIIVAAWLASVVEPWLKKVIPVTLRMILVPLVEVVVVSLAIILVLGPIVTLMSSGIAQGIQFLYDLSPAISGLIIGGLYQCLVIFGLHWAVIPLVAQDISTSGHSQLNALISVTMVAQGGAVAAVFFRSKIQKIKQLSGPAAISAFCGITEPAMYGVNLKYGRVFIMASCASAVGGLLTGLFHVNMWGFTGSLIGFTSFVNPAGLDSSFWGYLLSSAVALVLSFTLTWFFGFRDTDVEKGREVKKVRLGRRDPAGV
ncbi:glucose PTS transporter subunit IIA [Kocuria sp. HSID16901]|uniref:glucose PTS transporter subunit IIA n=1 Tax=Kocuria sp. HSID16901 TaxID=2419505 RepID=UPI0006614F4C|nr:PTS glucose transporter subunit IIABC [Kocuria sp. HSID16901]MCT1367145.1 glucose PTS transporter subunit IIA [Rothia sp. p3-SID1597]RUQ21848.1 PTS beta-glucoside transporter subunit IIABC [Kocuria sp. HSID16901]